MAIIHKDIWLSNSRASYCAVVSLSAVWMETTANTWDEPCVFLWSIFSGCQRRMSNSFARLLAATPHRAVPKWLCLPLSWLHLLPRPAVQTQLSFSSSVLLPSPSALPFFFHIQLFSALCSPPCCLSQHPVCIQATVNSDLKLYSSIDLSMLVDRSYMHVCWLIQGAGCLNLGVWMRLLVCDWRHFTDAVHSKTCIIDEGLHLRESPWLTPATMKPHRNPSCDTIEHKNSSKHSLPL